MPRNVLEKKQDAKSIIYGPLHAITYWKYEIRRNTTQLYLPKCQIYLLHRGYNGLGWCNQYRDQAVGWMTKKLKLRFTAEAQCVSHVQNIQTNTGAHQASYLVGCRGNVPSAKARHEADHSLIFSAKVMNCWSFAFTTSHIDRDKIYLYVFCVYNSIMQYRVD